MLQKLKTHIIYGKYLCGIEHTQKDNAPLIIGTFLKRVKKELRTENSFEVNTIEDIADKLPKHQHATLVINNQHVLTKLIEGDTNDILKLVHKSFPNINLEDFYFEVLTQGYKHFVSICRKSYINDIIDQYTKNDIYITNVSLGNSLTASIESFIDTTQIRSSNALIGFNNHLIETYETNQQSQELSYYNINGLNTSNKELLSLSAALQDVLNTNQSQGNFESKAHQLQENYNQQRFYTQFLKFGGLFILGLLLVNFIIFNHYFNKANELTELSQLNTATKERVITQQDIVLKKEKIVEDLLKSRDSKTALYSNEVMQLLPNTIQLKTFSYQPLSKRIKADKPISLENQMIRISGDSTDSQQFSNWIYQLEQLQWVQKVAIELYGSNSKTKSEFSIKLLINHD